MATLRVALGERTLFEFRLRGGAVTIGRADTCDIALPDEGISRLHCLLTHRRGTWYVADRSRHGVLLDGRPVDGGAVLAEGSTLLVGPYRLTLLDGARPARPTAPTLPPRDHELLVLDGGAVWAEQAALEVVEGPERGLRVRLSASRQTLGGPGSDVVIADPSLVADHCLVLVSRGRVILAPGAGAAWFAEERVRAVTPILEGETFRVGDTVLRVAREAVEDEAEATSFGELVGRSAAMRRIFGVLRRVAGHHHPVLLVGESGTGKELAARAIHEHGPRAGAPFVALNCGAIATELFESELFGHEKGAFTGAERRRDGAFQEADGGTLFLDEVGELPETAQSKLLRTLETGEVRRVGSAEVSFPDVRIIAATNRDLAGEVAAGRFREDLYYRLAVLTVEMPPLRERMEDVPLLARRLCRALDPAAEPTPEAMRVLLKHPWPGNVRELRNVLTRAWVLGGPRIHPEHLHFHRLEWAALPESMAEEDEERRQLAELLARHRYNRAAVARALGIPRSTLLYKLRRLGLG